MNTPFAPIGLTALAAIVAVGALNVTIDGPKRSSSSRPAVVTALNLKPESVERLVVSSSGRRLEVRQEGAGIWVPGDAAGEDAAVLMTEVEDRLFPLRAYKSFIGDPRPEYGLAQPEIEVRVQDSRRHWHTLAFGGQTFTAAGSYVQSSGDQDRIYLVARAAVDGLRSLVRGEKYETPRTQKEIDAENEQIESVKAMQERKPGDPLPPLDTVWLRQGVEHDGQPPAATQP